MKNKQTVQPVKGIVFKRADSEALATFDPDTKRCVMNCGPHAQDPRSNKERQFFCDECITIPAKPKQPTKIEEKKMQMTNNRPTMPGWYWYELPSSWPLQPVLVFDGGAEFGLMYTYQRINFDDDSKRDGLRMNNTDPRTRWSTTPITMADRNALQRQILQWACQTFGTETAANTGERISRFAEESLELMQSAGMNKTAVLKLVDYVYSRPAGEIKQEIGQVGVSLLGYAEHLGISADAEEQAEFNRILSLPPDHWQSRQNAKAKKGIALVTTPEESCSSFN